MQKEILIIAVFVMFASLAGAATISVDNVNSTLATVSISNAVNAYAYEINFSIDSGTVTTPSSNDFYPSFSAGASSSSKGGSQRNSYLYVYESRLDSSRTGYTNSGSTNLFNITHTGSITLRGHKIIDSAGSVDYASYNLPSSGSTNGSTSSSSGSTSGGTSSGGGAPTVSTEPVLQYKENPRFVTDPSEFDLSIVQSLKANREFSITYTGNSAVEVVFESEGDLKREINFEEKRVTLYPNEQRTIKFGVTVNERGVTTGSIIIIQGDTIVKKIPIVVNAKSENFLFDVKLDLLKKSLNPGNDVIAQVGLAQVGPQLKVDVTANYVIKDFEGNSYDQESETFYVLGEKEYSKKFSTAELKPGKYVLGLEIVYPGAFATSSSQFEIKSPGEFGSETTRLAILIGAAIIVLAGIVAIVWGLKKRKRKKK